MRCLPSCVAPVAVLIAISVTTAIYGEDNLAGSRPNILMIMPDDVSYGAFTYYGGGTKTPHVDELFRRGRRFENFHVSPTCSPTRASIMGGRHAMYGGVTHTIHMRDRLNLKTRTLADMLSAAGYSTGIFGKWHLGDGSEYRPDSRGFTETYIHGAGGIGQNFAHSADFPKNKYNDPVLYHNGKAIETKGYCTDLFFDRAIQWIGEQKAAGKRFFAYIPTNVDHSPHVKPASDEPIMVNFDNNVGKIMKYLEEQSLLESTLVVFLTDNGSDSGNKELTGGKNSVTEGGVRVPCVFYWKGRIEGGQSDVLSSAMDFWATFAGLTLSEEKTPGGKPWDGHSLIPMLEQADATFANKRYVVSLKGRWPTGAAEQHKYKNCAISDGRYKLLEHQKLVDLSNDIREQRDIAADQPEIVERLQTTYDQFWADATPYLVNEFSETNHKTYKPYHDLYRTQFG